MKEYVVDVNVIMAGLLSEKKDLYLSLLDTYILYVPDFSLVEIEKYKNLLIKKQVNWMIHRAFAIEVFKRLTVIPSYLISESAFERAFILTEGVDPKDSHYVALSIELKTKLITRDKKLYEGLLAKGFADIIMFDKIIDDFLLKK